MRKQWRREEKADLFLGLVGAVDTAVAKAAGGGVEEKRALSALSCENELHNVFSTEPSDRVVPGWTMAMVVTIKPKRSLVGRRRL